MEVDGIRPRDELSDFRLFREEKAREIVARLEVRRRFYGLAFLVFAVVVVSIALAMIGVSPDSWSYMVAWVGSSTLGTAVVLWWLYVARRESLYADAGRELLGAK